MLNLIGLILSFTVIILLLRKKINFGVSLLIGSIIVAVFSLAETDAYAIGKAVLKSLIYSVDEGRFELTTLKLALVMLLIVLLARSMRETGSLEKLIDSLRRIFSSKTLIALIPAVIGLLHVPGGALFSAPMIDEEGEKLRLSREDRAIFNVWFRHIWFLIYPMSTSIILICSKDFANINLYNLISIQFPTFFVMIVIGFFMMRKVKNLESGKRADGGGLIHIIPIVVPIIFSLSLSTFLNLESVSSLLLALPFGIFSVFAIEKRETKEIIKILKRGLSWRLPFAIVGIMIFRGVVTSSGVISSIQTLTNNTFVPPLLLIVLIPFVLAFFMGYNLGAIALSYPIVEPLFHSVGSNIVPIVSILYVSSFVGYLISPLHLCMVVTNEYFKPDIAKFYKAVAPSSISLIVIHLLLMLMLI